LLSFGKNEYESRILPNGKYHVKFIDPIHGGYDITIQDSVYTKYMSNGDSAKGRIYWINNSSFQLLTLQTQVDTSSELSNFLKKSFGEVLIELDELKSIGNDYYFRTTFTGNLHVTINTGQFIRILPAQ
jgi:hypothetical protein